MTTGLTRPFLQGGDVSMRDVSPAPGCGRNGGGAGSAGLPFSIPLLVLSKGIGSVQCAYFFLCSFEINSKWALASVLLLERCWLRLRPCLLITLSPFLYLLLQLCSSYRHYRHPPACIKKAHAGPFRDFFCANGLLSVIWMTHWVSFRFPLPLLLYIQSHWLSTHSIHFQF